MLFVPQNQVQKTQTVSQKRMIKNTLQIKNWTGKRHLKKADHQAKKDPKEGILSW